MTAESDESGTGDAKRTWVDVLYRQHSQALQNFLARQSLSRDEVADIVQETYYRIQQSGNVETIRNPKAFLFQVASNVRKNRWRHASYEGNPLDIDDFDVASDDPGPYRSFKGEQELAIVRAAFDELSPTCREAFFMNRFEDKTFVQIAAELDLSVSMIEKHVSHAIAYLRKRLDESRPALNRKPRTTRR